MRRDVFQAIADPTRREIINLIAHRSLNLNAIAENFHISRPAISQQIRILEECGLISIASQGRERFCEARLGPLHQVSVWIEQYREKWDARYARLDKVLASMDRKDRKSARSRTKKR